MVTSVKLSVGDLVIRLDIDVGHTVDFVDCRKEHLSLGQVSILNLCNRGNSDRFRAYRAILSFIYAST